MRTYKVKEPFLSQRRCLKTQLSQKKPQAQPFFFKQTDRALKPYSGPFFFREEGGRRGSERARHCSVFDQKTLEQSKNSFFKSD